MKIANMKNAKSLPQLSETNYNDDLKNTDKTKGNKDNKDNNVKGNNIDKESLS